MKPFVTAMVATLCVVFAGLVFAGLQGGKGAAGQKSVEFNRDVRPILSEYCYHCHGPDKNTREAKLRLDTAEGAYRDLGGYAAVAPGKPHDSELIARIISTDPDEVMPPPKSKKTMSPEEIDILRRWIAQGAPYEGHWAFVAPKRPPLPKVDNEKWARDDIDRYILARLEEEGLTPSDEADRRVLIRRVTFDLTGLPPTPEQVEAFVNDKSPNAYEKVVDRLLASPHYGEHVGRYWLDAVRYGDTHGLHLDNYREMWPYRDWVIDAFNRNLPYDRFATEQLAGDLLPDATLEQIIATGFNRCHVTTSEGGSIKEEVYVRNVVERTVGFGTVFLGLTLDCTRCHDHKFDPLTMKDFYSLFAFFNNIDGEPLDGNKKAHPPVVKAPTDEQQAMIADLDGQIATVQAKLTAPIDSVDAAQRAWEDELLSRPEVNVTWRTLDPQTFTSSGGATLTKLDDLSILASGSNPAKETYELVAKSDGKLTALRLEGLTHESLTDKGAGRSSNSNVVLTEFEADVAPADQPDKWQPVKFTRAWADHEQSNGDFKVANAIDGKPATGWAIAGHMKREDRTAIFLADKTYGYDTGTLVRIRVKHDSQYGQHQFGRIRLAATDAPAIPQLGSVVTLGTWHSVGPFVERDFGRAFNRKLGPEGKPFKADQTFTDADKKLTWTPRPEWHDGQVLNVLTGTNAATYLHRTVESSTPQKVTLRLGSDDAIKVWVNDKQVLAKNAQRAAAADQDKVDVQLKAGTNEIVLKVVNGEGGYGFFFALDATGVSIPAEVTDIVAIAPEKRTAEQAATLRDYYRNTLAEDPALVTLRNELATLQAKKNEVENAIPTTLVFRERKDMRPAFMLERGEYDQKGEQVERATPEFLPPMDPNLPRDRLGLAKWLTSPNHPLTARVAVNRFWQQCFGTGLVKTAEDFGGQGEWPSHPQLLDYLAVEFVESGWDIKGLMKRIVMSATYRQTSKTTPTLIAKDPNNRLLARGPRFRLEAEMLRDQALAVSGLLVDKLGGPSVKPPQPQGLWSAVGYTSSNTARFTADKGPENVHRRSIYTFWKRTAPPPQMSAFDAPSRESCTVRRERTNTPLQALLLMNDPQYVEAARALAERVMRETGDDPAARADRMFTLATARHPSAAELAVLTDAYADHHRKYAADTDAAAKLISVGEAKLDDKLDTAQLAAWTMVANLVLNMDEVVSKN